MLTAKFCHLHGRSGCVGCGLTVGRSTHTRDLYYIADAKCVRRAQVLLLPLLLLPR